MSVRTLRQPGSHAVQQTVLQFLEFTKLNTNFFLKSCSAFPFEFPTSLLNIHICVCVHIYIYIYICVCVCVHIYIYFRIYHRTWRCGPVRGTTPLVSKGLPSNFHQHTVWSGSCLHTFCSEPSQNAQELPTVSTPHLPLTPLLFLYYLYYHITRRYRPGLSYWYSC